jgi:hypothetical protein
VVVNKYSNTPHFETKEAAYQPGNVNILALKDSKVFIAALIGFAGISLWAHMASKEYDYQEPHDQIHDE